MFADVCGCLRTSKENEVEFYCLRTVQDSNSAGNYTLVNSISGTYLSVFFFFQKAISWSSFLALKFVSSSFVTREHAGCHTVWSISLRKFFAAGYGGSSAWIFCFLEKMLWTLMEHMIYMKWEAWFVIGSEIWPVCVAVGDHRAWKWSRGTGHELWFSSISTKTSVVGTHRCVTNSYPCDHWDHIKGSHSSLLIPWVHWKGNVAYPWLSLP